MKHLESKNLMWIYIGLPFGVTSIQATLDEHAVSFTDIEVKLYVIVDASHPQAIYVPKSVIFKYELKFS